MAAIRKGKAVRRPARRRGRIAGPRPVLVATIASTVGGWLLGAVVRRVSVRTGVSDSEALGPLPGDEVIPHSMVWTPGVTVGTSPERVWPWLVQMGYARGGWYTPQWVDLVANRWMFGERRRFPRSADAGEDQRSLAYR